MHGEVCGSLGNIWITTDTDLAYDRAGRLASATDKFGHVDTYTYDAASQLLSQVGSTSGAGDDWVYTYGEDGRRLTEAHAGTTVTYSHGPDGRITSDGTRTYTNDLAGRLTNNGIADLVYNPRGLLAEVNPTNPANHYEDRTYDGDGNLVDHTVGKAGIYDMCIRARFWTFTSQRLWCDPHRTCSHQCRSGGTLLGPFESQGDRWALP